MNSAEAIIIKLPRSIRNSRIHPRFKRNSSRPPLALCCRRSVILVTSPWSLLTCGILSEVLLTLSCEPFVAVGQSRALAAAADPHRFIHANAMPENLLNVPRNVHRSHEHPLHVIHVAQ